MEDLIKKYVYGIIRYEEGSGNVYDYANMLFGDDPLVTEHKYMVIPELGEIPSVKRNLVIKIVKKKTGYDIAPAVDMFTGDPALINNSMILIDKAVR